MPQASVKRLIEIEKKNLIDLVLDIDMYPNFIHYCINYDWCIFWCHNNGVLTEWKCRGLQNHCS